MIRKGLVLIFAIVFVSCSTKYLKVDNEEALKENKEFENAVKIETVQAPVETAAPILVPIKPSPQVKAPIKPAKGKKIPAHGGPVPRPPALEDSEGFEGRRPVVDPFRVGERVVLTGRYFKMKAGQLILKVDPFVQVNGKTAYQFVSEVKTASFFESIYSVEDKAVVLMDYDLLVPRAFTLQVRETDQVREARGFFDFDKNQATYWEKKVTKKSGVEEKKQQWTIEPFSQNVFSAIFYMRVFKWETGKEYSFRVADDEQNLIFKGKAIRREVIDTEIGEVKAIVIQPQIILRGAFKPIGDIFIWLSDDDRKLVLRMEAKLNFGTLVFDIDSMRP